MWIDQLLHSPPFFYPFLWAKIICNLIGLTIREKSKFRIGCWIQFSKIKVYWQVHFNFWQVYWSTTCKFSKRFNKTIRPKRSTISVLSNSFKAINFYPASLHCLRGSASRAATVRRTMGQDRPKCKGTPLGVNVFNLEYFGFNVSIWVFWSLLVQ
jgi:hypothetical protein